MCTEYALDVRTHVSRETQNSRTPLASPPTIRGERCEMVSDRDTPRPSPGTSAESGVTKERQAPQVVWRVRVSMTYAYATSPGDVDRPHRRWGAGAGTAHGGRRRNDDVADRCHGLQYQIDLRDQV